MAVASTEATTKKKWIGMSVWSKVIQFSRDVTLSTVYTKMCSPMHILTGHEGDTSKHVKVKTTSGVFECKKMSYICMDLWGVRDLHL